MSVLVCNVIVKNGRGSAQERNDQAIVLDHACERDRRFTALR